MQWQLQINRLQELIDQLECKVSAVWPLPCAGGTVWNLRPPGPHWGPDPCTASLTGAPAGTPARRGADQGAQLGESGRRADSWCGAGRRP